MMKNTKSEQPDAEDAKVTQKKYQKENPIVRLYFLRLLRNFGCFFCARFFCISLFRNVP